MDFIARDVKKYVIQLSQEYPVVGVYGPRQSGKTTLVKETFPAYQYISVEDEDICEFALKDPRGFLKRYRNEHGLIIDEIQRAPVLLSLIQTIVDEENSVGQFIVTGSQNLQMSETVTQSLAGRIGEITLLTLSLNELSAADLLPTTLDEALISGGYPRVHTKIRSVHTFYKNYIRTYIERDIRQIKNIGNYSLFKKFMSLCAGRIGQLINVRSLASDCGIDAKTAHTWLDLLYATYIAFPLFPYYRNFGKRVIQTPKMYFYDTGIACSLLKIRSVDALADHHIRGHLVENLIISDLYKQYYNLDLEPSVYFWRDQSQEIDCIIEEQKGLHALEIKAASTIASDFFDQLTYWNRVSNTSPSSNYLIYAGTDVQARKKATVLGWNHTGKLIKSIIQQ